MLANSYAVKKVKLVNNSTLDVIFQPWLEDNLQVAIAA
jgi:hypothetical protein